MHLARTLLLAAVSSTLLAWAHPADAQWAWRDAAGKMVFSDQPPPKSVAARDIVRQPGAPAAARAAPAEAEMDLAGDAKPKAQPAPAPTRRAPTTAEREMEARLRQQQLAEAEKKTAGEEARNARLAENCERLRGYQRALDNGMRIARVNAAGQQEVLDDAARAAERERTLAEIEQQCK